MSGSKRTYLVDDEQVRLRDARPSLARDLVATRDIDLKQ